MGVGVRIGTRGSALALWQARWVKSRLQQCHPGLEVDLVPISTRGDRILDVPLAKVGGKGLFVKELEQALLDGSVDLAVHSMKDVPAEFPAGLGLDALLEREDPRDALVSQHHATLEALPQGARVGSSSLRRQSQLKRLRPDLEVSWLRGNVQTRIDKMLRGEFDAVLLAAAGLKRLDLAHHIRVCLEPEVMLPAVGQGVVGLEVRLDDSRTRALTAPLDHAPTRACVLAERAFLAALEGGCQVPIAGHATLEEGILTLRGLVADVTGQRIFQDAIAGPQAHGEEMGRVLAATLLERGAGDVLREVYAQAQTGGPVSA
ncbi:MAG: hydroxymethylbilane synthase [Magnetococcus sp. WYHC-3]